MAEQVGDTEAVPSLKQSLAEEQSMADFIRNAIVPTTQKFMALTQAEQRAGV